MVWSSSFWCSQGRSDGDSRSRTDAIRECSSTLYVRLQHQVPPTNTKFKHLLLLTQAGIPYTTLTSTEHHISSLHSLFWVQLSSGCPFLLTVFTALIHCTLCSYCSHTLVSFQTVIYDRVSWHYSKISRLFRSFFSPNHLSFKHIIKEESVELSTVFPLG